MTFENFPILLAQEAVAPGTTTDPAADPNAVDKPGGPFGMMPFIILMFIMMYFLMIRPQQKRAKEQKAKVESLKIGSKVISAGGIHGLVTNISDKTVTVKVSDSTKIKFEKNSITQVFGGKDSPADDSEDAEEADEVDEAEDEASK
jgi:preprotein translocase subunit YajC